MSSAGVEPSRAGLWSQLVDWFVPPSAWTGGSDAMRRARLLVAVAGFLTIWSSVSALFQLSAGRGWAALIAAGASSVAVAALLLLRSTRNLQLATAVFAGGLFAAASVPNLATGGSLPAPMFLLALIATTATMLAGRKQGLVWAALAVVEIVAVQFLPAQDSVHFVSGPMMVGRTRFAQPLMAVALFMGMTLIYEHLKRRTLEELDVANAAVRRSSEARAEFVAHVTHELRTPVAGIIGLTDVLLEDDARADRRDHLQTVRRSADALMHLIGSVLDYAKLEAGRFDIVEEPFSPAQVARDVVRLLGPAADRAGISLRLDCDSTLPTMLLGDGHRLRQVLLNLAGNGIKFTRSGEVVVELGGGAGLQGWWRLQVSVRDTGPGIEADALERMFQPFEQVDHSARRRQGGTGLGLPITRLIVELMGAELVVQSEVGAGTTFSFELELPVHDGRALIRSSGFYDVVLASNDRSAPELYAGARPERGPALPARVTPVRNDVQARVLVAEDQEINRFLIGHVLEGLGIAHELVEDGAAAVTAAAQPGVALILMDLQMPVLDGIEAARAIRALPGAVSRVPIVALTASAAPEFCARCTSVGIDHVLEKPIEREALAEIVRELAPTLLPAESQRTAAPTPALRRRVSAVG